MSALLAVNDIHTYYGVSHILHGVSLEVRRGELVFLAGRNGAGKTTTIRSIIGYTRPRAGTVHLGGADMTRRPVHEIARLGIGIVPQGRRIFSGLTVRENLRFAERPADGGWDLERVIAVFPRLAERIESRGDQLSGGEQQMLAIARALLANPRVLLMDEPSEGLAPLIVREVGRVIARVKAEGLAVLLVEQNLGFGLSLADRCYVLNKGQIVAACSPDELRANDELKQRYLGV